MNSYKVFATRSLVGFHHFSSETASKKRITLALYRQLLRWCNETDEKVPLSYFVPPVYMSAPQIDEAALKSLTESQKGRFPANSIIETNQITCPIHTSADARSFFQSIFRLNRGSLPNAKEQKQRITFAFEALKSLNELTQGLNTLKRNRAKHVLRDGVEFRVGQVVKHKVEDWRGIVIAWERVEAESADKVQDPSSLTKKSYALNSADTVKYTVMLDSGDAHLHYSKRRESNILSEAVAFQSDLQLVADASLLRIRNTRSVQYFSGFDRITSTFVPNDIVTYEYPMDVISDSGETLQRENPSVQAATSIIEGIEDMGDHLRRVILDYTSAPESRKLKILTLFMDRILKVSSDEVLPIKDRLSRKGVSNGKGASLRLGRLVRISEDIGDLLWQRRRYSESVSDMAFSVGDIVKHKEYGFRGVIVASDPEPSVDVSRWDGLQNIKNPETYPFYHIIPDQGDCIQAFGGERPSRYCCEANLEFCPASERNIDVNLEPEWNFEASDGRYIPPEDVKFRYGIDLDDGGITKQCLMELRDSLTRLFVSIREGASAGIPEIDKIAAKLNMEKLMAVLKDAEDLDTATNMSDSLKEIWRVHVNGELKHQLDTAIGAMLGGKIEEALVLITAVVDEDPRYAEGWNKASTCEFMLGNLEASLAAAQKTLEILPNHFQAQNGLGLVYYEKKELPKAIECFRKSLELDPWSPVSARLALCLDTMARWQKAPLPRTT